MNILNKIKPYKVVCNFGTVRYCWSLKEAKDWLPFCGKVAVIGKRKKVLIQRIQHG